MFYNDFNHETMCFLKERAFFVVTGEYRTFNPSWLKNVVGLIKKEDVFYFREAVRQDLQRNTKDYPSQAEVLERASMIHECRDSTGREFITTKMGIYFIVEHTLTTENCFVVNDYRMIWPSKTIELMKNNQLPDLSRNYPETIKITDEFLKETHRIKEKFKAYHAAVKAEWEKKEQVFKDFFGLEHQELAESLLEFDYFYRWSDSSAVYQTGMVREKELEKQIIAEGFDPQQVFKLLETLHSKTA